MQWKEENNLLSLDLQIAMYEFSDTKTYAFAAIGKSSSLVRWQVIATAASGIGPEAAESAMVGRVGFEQRVLR